MNDVTRAYVRGPAGAIAVHAQGDPDAPAVVMTHSILSSSMMWEAQAALLSGQGWRVICIDTRGHGESQAGSAPWTMDDLAADTVAVLDALRLDRVHYVGLSLGGMSGFGLGIRHADRLLSLCLCDARADAPAAFAAPWDERIEIAQREGCGALAVSTTGRWFGKPFLDAHPELAERFRTTVAGTSTEGFVGCARAIQKLDYLGDVARIDVPTTLVVGANDGPLPQAMEHLASLIRGARLEVIRDAGHLPNIDQPGTFDAVLLRHLQHAGNAG
ncbi:alpha/beta hydrolase [Paraburkholderia fungorum]|uniref:alpha/beta fold hydrolase n=1 Tax=Paraburkholderia fungorum TaxID=134537 RepID=UPI0038BACBC6